MPETKQIIMSTPSRAIYSIDPEILKRFNALFKPGERSKVVEQLLRQKIAAQDQQLVDAAKRIESDPRFTSIREVSDDVDRIAGESL
jgi:hypothetical protein